MKVAILLNDSRGEQCKKTDYLNIRKMINNVKKSNGPVRFAFKNDGNLIIDLISHYTEMITFP